jgi:hypothetical protein
MQSHSGVCGTAKLEGNGGPVRRVLFRPVLDVVPPSVGDPQMPSGPANVVQPKRRRQTPVMCTVAESMCDLCFRAPWPGLARLAFVMEAYLDQVSCAYNN